MPSAASIASASAERGSGAALLAAMRVIASVVARVRRGVGPVLVRAISSTQ
jgi:TPP-dependent pyruvate/acetoin dehydrogenase alpha subunit